MPQPGLYPVNSFRLFCIALLIATFMVSCANENTAKEPIGDAKKKEIHHASPFSIQVGLHIDSLIGILSTQHDSIDQHTRIVCGPLVYKFYTLHGNMPLWSDTGAFKPVAEQLLHYLDTAIYTGLDREDYHHKELTALARNIKQTTKQPQLWAQADLLFTDAFMHLLADVKQGRLMVDSVKWTSATDKYETFFVPHLQQFLSDTNINNFMSRLEPKFAPYGELKRGLRNFVKQMDTSHYTRVMYPYKKSDSLDSLTFIVSLHRRLSEIQSLKFNYDDNLDSLSLAELIKKYQQQNALSPDGKISKSLISRLNMTDEERLKRIFVSLDRYKMLADSMPDHFVWVNLPAYMLKIYQHDTVSFSSKIVCGKSATPTPLLSSFLDEMIIYPTWTVPPGIIKKEMIPGLKKNNNYLSRKGLKLYDYEGKRVDPSGVDWSKYKNGIPFKIVQGSGERNALGVMKFNFSNPYFVYLHDTNQRGLFKNAIRALSHGCVRIENWKALSDYIATNDSINNVQKDTLKYNTDSISQWLSVKKSKRIRVQSPLKIYLQYVTCEGENGLIRFHEDIYGEDKKMLDKYFSLKK
jgi:murein L,D-transpeptidase YcbB/YkuD